MSVNGLPTDVELAVDEGDTFAITYPGNAGSWMVSDAAGNPVATGSGHDIEFTPTDNGLYIVSVAGEMFPVVVHNVAPEIGRPLNPIVLNEGVVQSPAQLVVRAGFSFSDAGIDDNHVPRVTVTSPSGSTRDLTGFALQFSAGQRIVASNPTLAALAEDFTVALWVKQSDRGTQGAGTADQLLVGVGDDATPGGWSLQLIDGEIVFAANGVFEYRSGIVIGLNRWTHVAAAMDADDNVQFYVDGTQVASVPHDMASAPAEDFTFAIGAYGGSKSFIGKLDNVAIWERHLSTPELHDISLAGINTADTSLLSYYPFDEGLGGRTRNLGRLEVTGVLGSDPNDPLLRPIWSLDVPRNPGNFLAEDEGDYLLKFTLFDDDGAFDEATTTISVKNVAPTAAIDPSGLTTKVGQVIHVSASDSVDPGPLDQLSFRWDVTSSTGQTIASGSGEQFAFVPAYPGSYRVALTATDPAGTSDMTEIVLDASPVVVIGSSSTSANEGEIREFNAFDSSPGAPGAIRSYAWTVTDGSGQTVSESTRAVLRFQPATEGDYTVALTVSDLLDGQTHSGSATQQLAVSNVVPAIVVPQQDQVAEGAYLLDVTVIDPGSADSIQLSIDWGDGSANEPVDLGLDRSVQLAHEYPEQGLYAIELTASDGQQSSAASQTELQVINVAPVVNAGANQMVTDGDVVSLTGQFSDLGNDTHTVSWDFGDGSAPVSYAATANVPFGQDHTYSDSGSYTVTLTVTDSEGAVGLSTVQIDVVNQAPDSLAVHGPTDALAGRSVMITGTARDYSGDQLRGTLDFGDGSRMPVILQVSNAGNGPGGGQQTQYEFVAQHVFTSGGLLPVTLSVVDQDGSESTSQMMLHVDDFDAPTIESVRLTDDSGTDRTDMITSDTTPSVAISFSEIVAGQASDVELRDPLGQLVSSYRVTDFGTAEVTVRPDGQLNVDGQYSLILLADGIQDTSGNSLEGGQNQTLSFTLDTTAPSVTLTSDLLGRLSPELTGQVDDAQARVTVQIDGRTYGAINRGDGSWLLPAGTINPALLRTSYDVSVFATDVAGNTNSVTGTLTISPAPAAQDDQLQVDEDQQAAMLDVLANDSVQAPAQGPLEIVSAGDPDQGGSVQVAPGGTHLTYSPAANFFGDETFTYLVRDAVGGESRASVVVHVQDQNDDPTATDDRFIVAIDSAGNVLNVLANDSSAPDKGELLSILSIGAPDQGGDLQIAPDGKSLRYTPGAGFAGQESFVYTLQDDRGGTAQAHVTVDVADGPTPVILSGAVDGQVDDLVVRRAGVDLEVFDNAAAQVVMRRHLSLVDSLRFDGADNEADRFTVDFAAGGYFALPGGIVVTGGAGGPDTLRIVGDSLARGVYQPAGMTLGDATVIVSTISSSMKIEFAGMEPLEIANLSALHIDPNLFVGSQQITIDQPAFTDLGSLTALDGGTVAAPGGVSLQSGDMVVGNGDIVGRVAAYAGTTITATGPLQLGDANRYDGFFSDGVMRVGPQTVTLRDRDTAVLGTLTELGNSVGGGELVASHGVLLEQGKTIQGYGTITADLHNQGHVAGEGPTASDVLDLTGRVDGTGYYSGNIRFSGELCTGQQSGDGPARWRRGIRGYFLAANRDWRDRTGSAI